MKNKLLLFACGVSLVLSSCGGDPELAKKVEEVKEITGQLKYSSERLAEAHSSLEKSFDKVGGATQNIVSLSAKLDEKAEKNQAHINNNIESLQKEQENLKAAFASFNEKIALLNDLYVKEGVVELSSDEGKINVNRFPALAQTDGEFIQEASCFAQYNRIGFEGRIQSSGLWKINGKEYKLFDYMTFHVKMNIDNDSFSKEAGSFYLLQVTFKNTHGEVVTTDKVKGYLLSEDGKDTLKWSVREVNGSTQGFIPKGTKCTVVLTEPLNLAIRK